MVARGAYENEKVAAAAARVANEDKAASESKRARLVSKRVGT